MTIWVHKRAASNASEGNLERCILNLPSSSPSPSLREIFFSNNYMRGRYIVAQYLSTSVLISSGSSLLLLLQHTPLTELFPRAWCTVRTSMKGLQLKLCTVHWIISCYPPTTLGSLAQPWPYPNLFRGFSPSCLRNRKAIQYASDIL